MVGARPGPPTILSPDEEFGLVRALKACAEMGFGLSRDQLRGRIAVLCSDGRPVPWPRDVGPGRDWFEGFFKRHPGVSERSSRIYDSTRMAPDAGKVRKFFDKWEAYVSEHQPAPHLIWNLDETGMSVDSVAVCNQRFHVMLSALTTLELR